MKTFLTYFLALGVFLLLGDDLLAQAVKITAEIRPRYEFRHGFKTPFPDGARPANFVSQRTRLNAYFSNNIFSAYVSLQDVRVWGDVNQLNIQDVNGFGVHEAWGEVNLCDLLSLKVGRQEVVYDDQRIFGAVGWAQQARSHDAMVFKLHIKENHNMDVGIAYSAMGESLTRMDYTNNNYKTMQWLYYHGSFEKSGLSILFLNNGIAYDSDPDPDITDEKISYSQTVGARYNIGIKKIKADAAFYYQGGKNGVNRDLSATYFSANITFQATKVFNVGIGTEYLSGTSSAAQVQVDQTDRSFTPFYGTNHKFNGLMDYFYVGNYAGQNGLVDLYIPLVFKVSKWTFELRPHYFLSAATVSSLDESNQPLADYSNNLGAELDLTISYPISNSVNIAGGYSQMFASETMQVVKYPDDPGGAYYKNTNNWAWIMITFKPTLFNKE